MAKILLVMRLKGSGKRGRVDPQSVLTVRPSDGQDLIDIINGFTAAEWNKEQWRSFLLSPSISSQRLEEMMSKIKTIGSMEYKAVAAIAAHPLFARVKDN